MQQFEKKKKLHNRKRIMFMIGLHELTRGNFLQGNYLYNSLLNASS